MFYMIEFLNKKIKELREADGLSQKELAEKLGIAKNTLSQYEHNKSNPSLEVIVQLSAFFDVSVDYLLGLSSDGELRPVVPYSTPILTEDEKELVDSFRRMPPNLQKIAIDTLHSFAGDREMQRSDGSIATRKA